MTDPKQKLTRFSQIYSAERRRTIPAAPTAYRDLPMAGALASANVLHETDASVLANLQRLYSISTVEEVVALARIDERMHLGLLDGLNVSVELTQRLVDGYTASGLAEEELSDWERFESLEYALGCEIDLEEPPPNEDEALAGGALGTEPPFSLPLGAPTPPPLPASVNLISSHMPPIKDQGTRGTCVAFTGVACVEYHLSRFGTQPGLDLSEQFAYWNMVAATAKSNLLAMFPLLQKDGVCRETTWAYYPKEIPGNLSQQPPPKSAIAEAPAYVAPNVLELSPRSVDTLKQALLQERLVGIGIPVYRSWFDSPVVRKYGNITVPIPGEVAAPVGHAVVLVGFADDQDYAGGGYFIVRNSWDHYWASYSALGSGVGTIPYRYIAKYNWDAWCVTV